MKKTPFISILLAVSASLAHASLIVSYTASADPNLNPDANGNTVDVWTQTTSGSGFAGSFLGDSSQNGGAGAGTPGSSGAGAGTSAWGLYSGGDPSANVTISHIFDGGALTIGQTVSITLDNGYVNGSGGEIGMRLNGAGGFNFALSFIGGDSSYRYYDGASGSVGVLGYTDSGFTLSLTLTSATTYDATITGGSSWSGTFANGGSPTEIEVYSTDNHGGGAYDFFANDLTVVPEPATYGALAGLALTGLSLTSFIQRRKRTMA